jgi:prepilin-type processing-associated H-X9-DG protein
MPAVGVNTSAKHSWITMILDELDQSQVRSLYVMDQSWDSGANRPAVSKHIRIVQCPSAPPDRMGMSNAAACDYGAINGVAPELAATGLAGDNVPNAVEAGCMYKNSRIRMMDIRDGLTNTVLVCEDAGRPQLYGPNRVMRSSNMVVTGAGWADRQNLFALHGATWEGTSSPGPCAINCTNSNEIYSLHSGGANILFADKTVRFLTTDIPIRIVGRLIMRNDSLSSEY